MSFMNELRTKISGAPLGSKDRALLKVILGELQNLPGSGKAKDPDPNEEKCVGHVKSIIKGNKAVIAKMRGKHGAEKSISEIESENEFLFMLLPQPQLTASDVHEHLKDMDLVSPPKDSAAIGMAMGYFKKNNLFLHVDGDVVKQVVEEIRGA